MNRTGMFRILRRTARIRRLLVAIAVTTVLASQLACSATESRSIPVPDRPHIAETPAQNMLYVAPNGDDNGSGTEQSPFRTIAKAATVATPGTRVSVADGTYDGSFKTTTNGTADARISYVAASKWGAKIVGTEADEAMWRNTGDYVDIVGFDIAGRTVRRHAERRVTTSASSTTSVHDFRADNCLITANEGYRPARHRRRRQRRRTAAATDRVVHRPPRDLRRPHRRGRQPTTSSYGNTGFGIHCWHNCNSLTISNNLVFDNAGGGIVDRAGRRPEQRQGRGRQLRRLQQHRRRQRPGTASGRAARPARTTSS